VQILVGMSTWGSGWHPTVQEHSEGGHAHTQLHTQASCTAQHILVTWRRGSVKPHVIDADWALESGEPAQDIKGHPTLPLSPSHRKDTGNGGQPVFTLERGQGNPTKFTEFTVLWMEVPKPSDKKARSLIKPGFQMKNSFTLFHLNPKTSSLCQKLISSRVWWCRPVIPATWEVETGR
jgi:hypothetical protein